MRRTNKNIMRHLYKYNKKNINRYAYIKMKRLQAKLRFSSHKIDILKSRYYLGQNFIVQKSYAKPEGIPMSVNNPAVYYNFNKSQLALRPIVYFNQTPLTHIHNLNINSVLNSDKSVYELLFQNWLNAKYNESNESINDTNDLINSLNPYTSKNNHVLNHKDSYSLSEDLAKSEVFEKSSKPKEFFGKNYLKKNTEKSSALKDLSDKNATNDKKNELHNKKSKEIHQKEKKITDKNIKFSSKDIIAIFQDYIDENIITVNRFSNISIGDRYFISHVIETFFLALHCIIAKPIFMITPSKITIRIFFFSGFGGYKRLAIKKKLKNYTVHKFYNFLQKLISILKVLNNDFSEVTHNEILDIGIPLRENVHFLNAIFYKKKEWNSSANHRFKLQLQKLAFILSLIFNKEVELECIELHYPFLHEEILAKFLSINGRKKTKRFNRMRRMLFAKARFRRNAYYLRTVDTKYSKLGLPFRLSGMKILLSGRLRSERVKPKKTHQMSQFGSFVVKQKQYVTSAMSTRKNRRGAFTFKILLAHTNTIVNNNIKLLNKVMKNKHVRKK